MKRLVLSAILASSGLFLGACHTFEQRTQEKAAAYAELTPEKKEALKKGEIAVGDSEDVVYIALGSPDERKERKVEQGTTKTWIYLSRSQSYEGTRHVGYERRAIYNPKTGKYGMILIPIEAEIYNERVEEALRVEFTDGKVSAIEEPKSP